MDLQYFWRLFRGVFFSANGFLFSLPTYVSVATAVAAFILWLWPGLGVSKMKIIVSILQQHPAFIIMGFLLLSVICTSYSLYMKKPSSFAMPDELIPSVLQNKSIRIADLAREDFVVRNRTFENCHIYGPAVVIVTNCIMSRCHFEEMGSEAGWIKTTNKVVAGAIILDSCVAKNCVFHKISFIGPPEQIDALKSQIQSLPGSKTSQEPMGLRDALSMVRVNQERRLATEYPLGYVMIAFSGDKKVILPYADRFEADWDKLKVYRDEQGGISVDIPYLHDTRGHSTLANCSLGTSAKPGSFMQFPFGSLIAQVECLQVDPIGIAAVLGFKENVNKT